MNQTVYFRFFFIFCMIIYIYFKNLNKNKTGKVAGQQKPEGICHHQSSLKYYRRFFSQKKSYLLQQHGKRGKEWKNTRKGKYWVNIRKMNNDSAEISISPGIQIYVHMKFMATII